MLEEAARCNTSVHELMMAKSHTAAHRHGYPAMLLPSLLQLLLAPRWSFTPLRAKMQLHAKPSTSPKTRCTCFALRTIRLVANEHAHPALAQPQEDPTKAPSALNKVPATLTPW
jgi:hypothetical protein